ncbi:MAG: hypothetical protein HY057_10860 [Rhodospirillales bacterium]|nr:hypothetical protein [Rhodospirillales bacterium]
MSRETKPRSDDEARALAREFRHRHLGQLPADSEAILQAKLAERAAAAEPVTELPDEPAFTPAERERAALILAHFKRKYPARG